MTGVFARRWIADAWGSPAGWRLIEFPLPDPRPGEISVRVRAAGVNPADAKHVARPRAGAELPRAIGYEISGEIIAVGEGTEIASGPASIGDEVLAFRISGGYATHATIPAEKAFHKPDALTHAESANLLLAGTTAAEMLAVVEASPGETVLLHGASGAVGVSVLQQAALRGIRVIGTASEARFAEVSRFGGAPVAYGPGLQDRVRALADGPISAALDAVGTPEAIDVSLALVEEHRRIVTIAAAAGAGDDEIRRIAGAQPASARFRDAARAPLIDLAARRQLVVPVARTYPLAEAPAALAFLAEGHPGGKIALLP